VNKGKPAHLLRGFQTPSNNANEQNKTLFYEMANFFKVSIQPIETLFTVQDQTVGHFKRKTRETIF
jgi:hypothetical protein